MPRQTKTKKFTIDNNKRGQQNVIKLRREVDERQNSKAGTLFTLLANLAGLCNVALGIGSLVFGGAVSGNDSYLERMENMYSTIYEDFTTKSNIKSVTITTTFETYGDDGVKGVIWKAYGYPTYKYTYK